MPTFHSDVLAHPCSLITIFVSCCTITCSYHQWRLKSVDAQTVLKTSLAVHVQGMFSCSVAYLSFFQTIATHPRLLIYYINWTIHTSKGQYFYFLTHNCSFRHFKSIKQSLSDIISMNTSGSLSQHWHWIPDSFYLTYRPNIYLFMPIVLQIRQWLTLYAFICHNL